MKILFISDVYFPRVNGVSTSIKTFINELKKLGHQVDLIAPDYGIKTEDESFIKRVDARSIYFDPEDKLMKYSAGMKLMDDLKRSNYDLIHIHTPFIAHYLGIKLSKHLNIPCVETYHTFFEDYLHHYLPWLPKTIARSLARVISKKQCNGVDAIVSPSQPMLDVLRKYGVTVQAEVIPTGLQESSFSQADGGAFRKKYNIPADRIMLLYVGRVAFEKNIEFLLEMTKYLVSKYPDVLLVVAGEGPAEKSLHELSKKLNLENNVQFIGYLARDTELNACYQAADIFVFASKSETQGLVLIEAMAQGTPVVAIAELGTASILVEGEGVKIAPDELSGFAEKVEYLICNPAERQSLAKKARKYVESHWMASMQAERMAGFYNMIVKKSNIKQ
jgi:1,2-diacylglycerol 3-alpha-glucosyltransferase